MKFLHSVTTAILLGALALSPALSGCESSDGEGADDVGDDIGFEPTDTTSDEGETVEPDVTPDAEIDVRDIIPPLDIPDVPDADADVEETTDADAEDADDTDVEDVEPDVDTGPDVCVPDCEGKVCGPDGCGSICGFCQHPKICSNDQTECEEFCAQACEGKVCGPDGCGGSCGSCADRGPKLECVLETGKCKDIECVPNCANKVCGDDGCDGLCGTCGAPKLCNALGTACELGPCGNITAVGECQDDVLVWCDNAQDLANQELVEEDCAENENHECKWDGFDGRYTCVDTGPCEPDCTGKPECGADGCGGTCGGGCDDGWSCLGGYCEPETGAQCGTVTDFGECGSDGTTVWWCNPSNKLQSEDCAAFGEKCGYDQALNKMNCVPN